jgi:thymidylate synthase
MKVIHVRNVQEALPRGMKYLLQEGVKRDSRNGAVYVSPCPVTTVYDKPCERVLFWDERDANPFFHLYESLWMLQGRNDVQAVARYNKRFLEYSDDGEIVHGAYGHRWKYHFGFSRPIESCIGAHDGWTSVDQLKIIATRLSENANDRRSVLQMWDPTADLRTVDESKDVPCNTTATFQVSHDGRLDLTVLCRSNDIIWGAYGANAVHFTILQEYMANWTHYPVGKFYQVSVNYHAYELIFHKMKTLAGSVDGMNHVFNPYVEGRPIPIEVSEKPTIMQDPLVYHEPMQGDQRDVDGVIRDLVEMADKDQLHLAARTFGRPRIPGWKWAFIWWTMLEAHEVYRNKKDDGSHYQAALDVLHQAPTDNDFIAAGIQWMERRQQTWSSKQFDKEIGDFKR